MGYVTMHVAQVQSGFGQTVAWEYEQNLSKIDNGDWILIPDSINCVSVTVSFSGGATGKLQTTKSRTNVIKSGNATADDWIYGTISTQQEASCDPVSGIRAVQETAGTMKLEVRTN